MGINCSCIGDNFLSDKEPELIRYAFRRVSSTESTLNSVIKIQSLWRGYQSRKKVSIFVLPALQSPKGKTRESQIPVYKFPVLSWRGKPKAYVIRLANLDFYKGEWVNNLRHGQGMTMSLNGEKYMGYYKNDKRHGHGRCIYASGDVYEGGWEEDKRSGTGSLHCMNGFKYSGTWVNNLYDGKGQEFWSDGTLFVGNYVQGKKTGYGEFFWSDRLLYVG
jgi:hypothetical protein